MILGGCSKQKTVEAPSIPTVVAGSYAIADLASQLGEEDFKIVYPVPSGTNPGAWQPSESILAGLKQQLVDAGEIGALFAPKTKSLSDWVGSLKPSVGKFVELPFSQPGFSPRHSVALVDAIAVALTKLAPEATTRIEERREKLVTNGIEPLINRWDAARNAIPEQAHLLGMGQRFASVKSALDVPVSLIKSSDFETEVAGTKAKYIFLPEPPADGLADRLAKANVDPVILRPGLKKPSSGNFLNLLEQNVESLEALSASLVDAYAVTELPTGYHDGVLPVLEKYCMECHDEENEEGEVNFELFLTEAVAVKKPDFWESVTAQVDLGAMPPAKKDQPTEEEREVLLNWIAGLSQRWDDGEFGSDPGRTTIRRLNKNEYNYTIRDLFGMQVRPADQFPEDGGGAAGFDNNADALFLPPLLMENYVEASGVVAQAVFANKSTRQKFLLATPGAGVSEEQAARKVLSTWATRAYRRLASKGEVERLVTIFKNARMKKRSYAEAMQMPLVAMLISPNFLYRSETEKEMQKAYPVDNFDLASRLSYFLWSSMPDGELFRLANSGELNNDDVLETQVLRMLGDKKSASLAMHFGGQWFGWELLRSRANPDETRYPEFGFPLRVAMYRESTAFFQHLIDENASAYDLIDCNYAFLNDRLAYHYKIPGVTGSEFRKVSLNDRNRGGVLGMGSVLVATSLPLRTSPAVRGDYVLGALLGTPPPEPPMNVEQLAEDDRAVTAHSFREELEQHREDPNCRSCHETIDPIGFGLENFDVLGRWRTEQNGFAIDSTGEMPDGAKIASPADIKELLMKDKALFARNLSEKLLSYALGRELTPYDRPVLAKITQRVMEDDGNIHTAFVEVAKSYPFRNRRNDDFQPTQ